MAQGDIYGFDCGTTNWRIYRLGFTEKDGVREPKGQPQRMALTTFTGTHLPAALLLDEAGAVLYYGNNAYQQARDPTKRAGLRDAFKLCVGNRQAQDALSPRHRYSHDEALEYTRLLLAKVVERLGVEWPTSMNSVNLFYFAHPVHWGLETADGGIEGDLLPVFAAMVRGCFPEAARERVHFVPEPEAALLNLAHSGQAESNSMILVVDVGGGTTDLAAGQWTQEGLREPRYGGGPHGSGLYDHDLARFVAEQLNIPEILRPGLWTELCDYGKELKEDLSRQISMNPDQPVSRFIGIPVPGGEPPYFGGSVKLERAIFEQATQATSEQFKSLVLEALVRMDLRRSDIQQVVLVGGGANLYLVPGLLKDLFQEKVPITYASPPEEAIVSGAVWRAMSRHKAEPPPLPAVQNIHGWSAKRVQALQKQTAEALDKPVVFRDRLKSGDEGPEMVVIPAGRFLMGSPANEPGRFAREGPQHEVTFQRPFVLGRYAVTFDEYDQYPRAVGEVLPEDAGWGRGRRPVIYVSWEDAQAYCAWLSAQTGKRYRLPSEAEWEYACRAGTVGPFYFGSTITPRQANYDENFAYNGGGAEGEWRKKTLPVDEFAPNAFGLYQMHGNVWEWCEDTGHGNYNGAPADGSAWVSGGSPDDIRVLRGSSWLNDSQTLRSATRAWPAPALRLNSLGFRLAQDISL